MSIFDELKSIAKILREADKIPQYEQILGIQEKLLEMQSKIAELTLENKELKESINLKKNLVHKGEVYYFKEEDKEIGPFCANCYDARGLLMRMTNWVNAEKKRCPNCEKSFRYF